MSDEDPRAMAFSHPARLTKAVNMLEGLVRGVTIDRLLNDAEVFALKAWIRENAEFARHPVFGEVIARIQTITETGTADEDVRADLLWFCEKFVDEDQPVDQGTAATQVLHGMRGEPKTGRRRPKGKRPEPGQKPGFWRCLWPIVIDIDPLEAAGIEPASCDALAAASTCVVC